MDGDNYVSIVGRLGVAPKLEFLAAGTPVCEFRIAQTQRKKEGDQWVDGETFWYPVKCWRKLAEKAASLPVGAPVRVTGKLIQESWKTEQGENRYLLKVRASAVDVVTGLVGDIESGHGEIAFRWGANRPEGGGGSRGNLRPVPNEVAETIYDYDEEPF